MGHKEKNVFKIFGKDKKKDDSEIMTLEEIQNVDVNYDVMKEALQQAEKRLKDLLLTKNSLAVKSFVLLAFQLIMIVGLMYGFNTFQAFEFRIVSYLLFFLIMACLVNIFFSIKAFTIVDFGSLGSHPSFWLRDDTITQDKQGLAKVIAYLVHSYEERINVSYGSLDKMVRLQDIVIAISLFVILVSSVLFSCVAIFLF